tara:strand:+ start:514 stop:717 length:204 start_codon:yes stop_codon:yes gene_type:complete
MRKVLIDGLKAHALGHIEKHKANVEIYLHGSVGIGEHSDIVAAIQTELNQIAHYEDQLEVIDKYFTI